MRKRSGKELLCVICSQLTFSLFIAVAGVLDVTVPFVGRHCGVAAIRSFMTLFLIIIFIIIVWFFFSFRFFLFIL